MLFCALDIGGTKTMVSVAEYKPEKNFSGSFRMLGRKTFPTGTRSFGETAAECVRAAAAMLKENDRTALEVEGVGISAPGMVSKSGMLVFSPVTGWRDVDIAGIFRTVWSEEFSNASALPVNADCDVNACALAEVLSSGAGDMLWVTVSTGIGGAFVSGGRIYTGHHSVAGEIGHTKVEYTAPKKCACGQYGCAEAHASGTAVGKAAADRAKKDMEWAGLFLSRSLAYSAESCSILAREGDRTSLEIMKEAGDYLGRALANAANLLDPAVIYIGGGMSRSLDLMADAIRRRIESDAIFIHRDIPVLPTALGYDASLMGAFALAADIKNK